MHVTRSHLIEARSMRDMGLTHGSVGQFDACALDYRVSRREITPEERAARKITGAEERPWILGSWQQEQSDIPRARLASNFAQFQAAREEKARVEGDYQRMVREARSGLDMKNPRHVARFEARMQRAQEAAQDRGGLNAYLAAERSCGRAV